jgi:enoyl-CoA hydratase/carnithine racemase
VTQREYVKLKQLGVDLNETHQVQAPEFPELDRRMVVKPWVSTMIEQMEWDKIDFQECTSAEEWMNSDYLFEVRQGISYCTLNDIGNNNSFSQRIVAGFLDSGKIHRERRDIRVAVLTGNGRMFCAGGDPRGFQAEQRAAGVIGSAAQGGEKHNKPRPPRDEEGEAGFIGTREKKDEAEERGRKLKEILQSKNVKFSGKWPPRGGGDEDWDSLPQGGPPGYYITTYFEQNGVDANIKGGFRAAWHFFAWATIPQFSICCMNGSAMGGALGILAGSDFVCVVKTAFAVLSEVRLGVIPAVVSPHVIRAVGAHNAKRIFIQAENLNATKQVEIGLCQRMIQHEREFPGVVVELVEKIQMTDSSAVMEAKACILASLNQPMSESLIQYQVELYNKIRKGEPCEAGMKAFADRQPAPWESCKIDVKTDSVKADPANMPAFKAFMDAGGPSPS